MLTRETNRSTYAGIALLTAGFLLFAAGVAAVAAGPPGGSDVALYATAPLLYWIGIATALAAALLVVFALDMPARVRDLALGLAGSVGISIVGLPLLTGYYFYGRGDSLTHLGWVRMLESGSLDPTSLLYPAVHTVAVALSEVAGFSTNHALELAVVLYAGVFLLFVPMCVRVLADHRWAFAVGAVSALLFLPVNNVSTFVMAHPTTQALFVLPLVLYLLFRYLSGITAPTVGSLASPDGVLLGMSGLGFVLLHPQQALSLAFFFLSILVLRRLAARYEFALQFSEFRSLTAQTSLLFGAFLVWSSGHERVGSASLAVLEGLIGGSPAADEVVQRSSSLGDLGGSVVELFVKLFSVGLLYALLTVLAVGVALYAHYRGRQYLSGRSELVVLVAAASVPVMGGFLAFGAASLTTQPFRYLAALLVIGTVLGAVALADGLPSLLGRSWRSRGVRALVVVVLAASLVLQLAVLHPSPYIYKSSGAIEEAEYDGYTTAFDSRPEGMAFTGLRAGPGRWVDAHYGTYATETETFPGKSEGIPGPALADSPRSYYNESRYLPISDNAVWSETVVYEGLRYPERAFDGLRTTPGIGRVHTTGALDLYLIESREE